MTFIETVFQKLKRHPKRVVFPEGTEPRVLRAAARYVKLQLGAPVVLGRREEVEKVARDAETSLDHIGIIDPETSSELPTFIKRLEKLKRYHDLGSKEARDIFANPNYFAAMMVQYGQVDALVTGAREAASSSLRPLIQLIKPQPDTTSISSCTMLDLSNKRYGERGVMLFADCAVIPEPTVEQLATIAFQTGTICRQLTGNKPRVAMLSFTTKGDGRQASPAKVAAATALAKQKAQNAGLEMEIDGEMQADSALLPDLAEKKHAGSLVAGKANVLIFPNLDAGNIGLKLVQHLAGAETYGQILLGLSKPCADMSRGASEDDILGVAAILGLQAIAYRKLYPTEAIV
ncbi:MAG TPA: phosphate acyltransferase [Chthoniobacteraceae bacterium]|jgi:phosphate acetyltransferase|nr:Phosphate acetyltransferase [Chthoniobacter sp.]HEV7866295.1 phosphate acyltransferase [Chthoniobacteraceae bacterium]